MHNIAHNNKHIVSAHIDGLWFDAGQCDANTCTVCSCKTQTHVYTAWNPDKNQIATRYAKLNKSLSERAIEIKRKA